MINLTKYNFLIIPFYILLKKINKNNEEHICIFNKSVIIWCFFFRNRKVVPVLSTTNQKKSPEKLNSFFVNYYIFSIFNHLKFNKVDIFMMCHHILTLSFLVRNKYKEYQSQVNFIHGNLIMADYFNTIFPFYCRKLNITGNNKKKIRFFSEFCFIINKSCFIPYMNWFLTNKKRIQTVKKGIDNSVVVEAQNVLKLSKNWILTNILMYLAMFLKLKVIKKLSKNNIIYKFCNFSVYTSLLLNSIFFKI